MPAELRNTGISAVGDMPWGTHFSLIYETRADLLDSIVPYFTEGLKAGELCVWMPSDPRAEADATEALRREVPDLDAHVAEHHIEFISAEDWYRPHGRFDVATVMRKWSATYARVLEEGHTGLRGYLGDRRDTSAQEHKGADSATQPAARAPCRGADQPARDRQRGASKGGRGATASGGRASSQ